MRRNQILAVLVGVAAAVLLFVVLRPGDDEDAAATAPATTAPPGTVLAPTVEDTNPGGDPATVPETETAVEPPTTTAPEEPGPTVPITLSGGRPAGGIARITVEQGERVRIVVRSDEPDEVHLHGYDLTREVAPNAPAQLIFTADIPGRFELESHQGGGRIAQLEVRP